MIRSFADKRTQALFEDGVCPSVWRSFERAAIRKLIMMDAARDVQHLRFPPGNRLEMLHGDRKGQWSIRINDQYRICFEWSVEGPHNVEIVDYH